MVLARLVDEAGVFLPAGTLESFRLDLGLSYAQAGIVLAALAPGALLGSVLSAAADRHSRRAIAAGGAFGFAASLAVFATGRSFPVLALASLVMGAAGTAMVDAAEVALVDLAGDDLRPCLARSNLLGVVGDLVGPALIAAVAAAGLSWRVAFGIGAALLLVYGALLWVVGLPPPVAAADGPAGEGTEQTGAFRAVASDSRVWVIGLVGLAMVPFDETLVGFTIALAEHHHGASTFVATAVALVGVSGGLLSYTVLARRLAAVEDERLLLGSAIAMALGTAGIAFAPVLALVAAGAFVASVGLNLAWLAVQHCSLTLRPGQTGATLAIVGDIEIPGLAFPVAIGFVADRAGLTTAVTVIAAVGVALVLLVWRVGLRPSGT